MLAMIGDSGSWVLEFRRPLRAWEVAEEGRLIHIINGSLPTLVDRDDCLRWVASSSSQFSVASFCYGFWVGICCNALLWSTVGPPVVVYYIDGKKLIHKEIANKGCCCYMELLMVLGRIMLVWVSSDLDEDRGAVVGAISKSYLLV
ncbi:hypothetical protein LOK49_LG04G02153 [Camellia lanceoleosa]|uniref:Uncharacterized protein n=1 Tax=Camellia lanceoleosa TaxID=1840588 RepID=A0ACC0I132_9ERIC|nr:hypothetical protein LOK49_LG04G02153 [Camellia lanceoleosa]